MSLAQNLAYLLIGFVALVSIFLIVLALIEKKLRLSFIRGKYWRNDFYMTKISNIKTDNLDEALKSLNQLMKSFFREAFHIKGPLDNSYLEQYFVARNNKKATKLIQEITRLLYSGEKLTKEKLQELIGLAAEIISSNKIITKEQKEEFDRKSKEHDPLLRKVNISPIKNINVLKIFKRG